MAYLKQFIIHLQSLSVGEHQFEYKIDDQFFDCFEYAEIKKGSFDVQITIHKTANTLALSFYAKGKAELSCDRCLSSIEIPVEGEFSAHIKQSDITEDDYNNDNLIVIPKGDLDLDLAPVIYENIHLLLPLVRNNCIDSKNVKRCDEEVLAKLEQSLTSEKGINTEAEIDPRWEALRKLKE